MGVLMQAFYWDCPRQEQQEKKWWTFVSSKLDELKRAGFTALWLPPASKAANLGGMSMGYDIYDYADLGTFNQKGSIETWFGSEAALRSLIQAAHGHQMQVYADLVVHPKSRAENLAQGTNT
jgi:alpha-amylase